MTTTTTTNNMNYEFVSDSSSSSSSSNDEGYEEIDPEHANIHIQDFIDQMNGVYEFPHGMYQDDDHNGEEFEVDFDAEDEEEKHISDQERKNIINGIHSFKFEE